MRRSLRWIVLAAALGAAGCDEPATISNVDRTPDMVLGELWKIQDPRGIPVEIHGSPFRRIADSDLVAALAMPAGSPRNITFYVIPAGSAETGYPWRLVLHFNPQGPPNAVRDCTLTEEARTNALPEGGFAMNAVFCQGKVWKAHGFLEVREIGDNDREAFSRHFQSLIAAIFAKDPDR